MTTVIMISGVRADIVDVLSIADKWIMSYWKESYVSDKKMAPDTGFEPVTKRLTVAYSTAELIRNS